MSGSSSEYRATHLQYVFSAPRDPFRRLYRASGILASAHGVEAESSKLLSKHFFFFF